MQIIEKPDPKVQLDFLTWAIVEQRWAIFPLQKIIFNYDGTRVRCGCKEGFVCPRIGKCPRVKWGTRANYIEAGDVAKWLKDGFTNFGIHLGWSGLCVLDIDPRNGGDQTMHGVDGNRGYMAKNSFVMTGSGGFHIYFLAPDCADPIRGIVSVLNRSSTNVLIGPGVEFLSGQHFIVAPYSQHKNGHFYTPIFGVPFATFQGTEYEPTEMDLGRSSLVFSEQGQIENRINFVPGAQETPWKHQQP